METQVHADSKGKVAAWINIDDGKGCSSWVRQQSENMQASAPCALNPKSLGFDIVSRTPTVPNFKSFRSGVFVL